MALIIAVLLACRCLKQVLKRLQQSDMRAQKAWIGGSVAEILAILRAREMTGEQLKNLRKSLGLTQRELAEILGVTPLTVIRSEKHGPSRMVQSFIDRALRAGELGLPALREASSEYGKKPSKRPRKKRS